MRIFLDVGAHTGQTLLAAMRWPFDRIVCFEPVEEHIAGLHELADKRCVICDFGLWNQNAKAPLYDAGSQGASLWKRPKRSTKSALCTFMRVSEWLTTNIHPGDQVWMKVNAEGAELDIIEDMLDTGTFDLVSHLEVMWDSHKIPAVAGRLAGVKERLSHYTAPRVFSSKDLPPAITHVGRIDNWLAATGLPRP